MEVQQTQWVVPTSVRLPGRPPALIAKEEMGIAQPFPESAVAPSGSGCKLPEGDLVRGNSSQETHSTYITRVAQEAALATPVVVRPVSNPVTGEKVTDPFPELRRTGSNQPPAFLLGKPTMMSWCVMCRSINLVKKALHRAPCVLESPVRVTLNKEEDFWALN